MLREWQTVNQAGLSPHDVHCHQYLAISRYLTDPPFSGAGPSTTMMVTHLWPGREAGVGQVAITVINHYGDEVLKAFEV